jgi:hypothetical protein
MATVARPRIREVSSRTATESASAANASQSGDSREQLISDVLREINAGIDEMPAGERTRAIADIHAIAENVRKRRA